MVKVEFEFEQFPRTTLVRPRRLLNNLPSIRSAQAHRIELGRTTIIHDTSIWYALSRCLAGPYLCVDASAHPILQTFAASRPQLPKLFNLDIDPVPPRCLNHHRDIEVVFFPFFVPPSHCSGRPGINSLSDLGVFGELARSGIPEP